MGMHREAGAEAVPGYRLVRRLGRGGFGEVWEAEAPGKVRVALKFIALDEAAAGPELRALEVIRNIRHPHLLDIQFAVHLEDTLVIAMPLCDESLWDRLRVCRSEGHEGVPRDELIGYMDEVARAVDFLNEPRHPDGEGNLMGVQHRDIKPHNIFLVGGSARLADFGLAKVLEHTTANHSGAMSPNYVAPEVLEGHVTRWTDQYSLALTYCQLRTGRLPFSSNTIGQVVRDHLHGEADLSGLPDPERPAVHRALARTPEARWPSCRDFVRALDGAVAGVPDDTESMSTVLGALATSPAFGPGSGTSSVTNPWISGGPGAGATATEPSTGPSTLPSRRRGRGPAILAGTGVLACLAAAAGVSLRPDLRGRLWPAAAAPIAPLAARTLDAPRATEKPAATIEAPARPIETAKAPGTAKAPDTAKAPAKVPEAPAVAKAEGPEAAPADAPPATPRAEGPPAAPKPGRTELAALGPEKSGAGAGADTADPKLADQAYAILKQYCYNCHGIQFKVAGYNVLDRDILVAKRGDDEQPYIVPGKPDASDMWAHIGVDKDMPPPKSKAPKPSDADRELIKAWIVAGAPFPVKDVAARPVRAERDVLALIRDHLRRARPEDRPNLRYFSIANLHNNRNVTDDELRLTRAAMSKVVNSLSWQPDIVVPKAIDAEQTVFAIDVRDVGWDARDVWKELLTLYPYGLKHDKDPSEADRSLAQEVAELSGTSLPFLRADWFISNASRPPLYHTILDLPKQARDLEKLLKVDVVSDFLRDKLARAGFAESGVSSHNRVVDRHPAVYGAYWKSYDFRRSDGPGNIFRFPLGPVFDENPFPNQAFEHAGGEIVFNLPNGLQGYLLVDNKGDRLDVGPIDIVGDDLKTSGTSAIVNGLSCMACHQTGIRPFKDRARAGLAISGSARAKAETLISGQETMDKLVAKDESRFLSAEDQAMAVFLKVGPDASKAIRDFAEPVGAVARSYLKDVGADDVAAEFGLKDPKDLPALIRSNARLRQLGLGPLQNGGSIKRSDWDSFEGRFLSTFHEAARELEIGTPFRAF